MCTVTSTESTEQGWVTTMKLDEDDIAHEGGLDFLISALQVVLRLVPEEYRASARYDINAVSDGYGPDDYSCRADVDITYERPATDEEIAAAAEEERIRQAVWEAEEYMRTKKFHGFG